MGSSGRPGRKPRSGNYEWKNQPAHSRESVMGAAKLLTRANQGCEAGTGREKPQMLY